MNSVSPVLTEAEIPAEQVIALGQEEYYPIIVCRVTFQDKDGEPKSVASLTRFRFSDKEREAIAKGADLILSQPHHGLHDARRIAACDARSVSVGGAMRDWLDELAMVSENRDPIPFEEAVTHGTEGKRFVFIHPRYEMSENSFRRLRTVSSDAWSKR